MNFYNNSYVPIDPEQFQKKVGLLDDKKLNEMIEKARAQGIPESAIKEGLYFIEKIKKTQ